MNLNAPGCEQMLPDALNVDRLPSVSDLRDQIAPALSRPFRCTPVRASKSGTPQTDKPQRRCQRKLDRDRFRHFLSHGTPNTLTEFGGAPTLRLGETSGQSTKQTNRLAFTYTYT